MPLDALQLLRKLEPPIRRSGATGVPGLPFEQQDFQTLLASVATSGHSDQPIRVSAELNEPLTEGQEVRLAVAADVAARHGADRALLLMDGRGLVLDVAVREITAELQGAEVVDLDVAVYVAGDEEITHMPPGPGSGVMSESIAIARNELNTPSNETMRLRSEERADQTD